MADRVAETTGIYHIRFWKLEVEFWDFGRAVACEPREDCFLQLLVAAGLGALGVPCPSSASASHRVYPAGPLWPLSPLLITPPVIGRANPPNSSTASHLNPVTSAKNSICQIRSHSEALVEMASGAPFVPGENPLCFQPPQVPMKTLKTLRSQPLGTLTRNVQLTDPTTGLPWAGSCLGLEAAYLFLQEPIRRVPDQTPETGPKATLLAAQETQSWGFLCWAPRVELQAGPRGKG